MTKPSKPPGTGWTQQRERWRLMVSMPRDLAQKLGEEAQSLGIPPATLVTTLIGRHYASRED